MTTPTHLINALRSVIAPGSTHLDVRLSRSDIVLLLEHVDELHTDAQRALAAWDTTVLPASNDGRLQEAMEYLRRPDAAATSVAQCEPDIWQQHAARDKAEFWARMDAPAPVAPEDRIEAVLQRQYGQIAALEAEIASLKAAASAPVAPDVAVAIELQGVREALAEGRGVWAPCSGCHELTEGHATGAFSSVLSCHLGNGCSECGGIGAVWDDTDYDEMARSMMSADAAPPPVAFRAACDGGQCGAGGYCDACPKRVPAPVAQPAGMDDVAALVKNAGLDWQEGFSTEPLEVNRYLKLIRAVEQRYAPAPVAQPLTDEQIDALSDDVFDLIQDVPDELVGSRTWDRMFARAIERAHGIGGAA